MLEVIKMKKSLFEDEMKRILEIAEYKIMVGIPEATDARNEEVGNAALGYIHEFGSPIANIPARPFLIPSVEEQKKNWEKRLGKAASLAIDGDIEAAKGQMEIAGQQTRDAVKSKIASNIQPALAPYTIMKRVERGVTRTNTLIDTGSMLRAVNYVVKKKDSQQEQQHGELEDAGFNRD